jgi:protein-S-isoprenylcysteine O-methyltransferase Ste14
MPETPGTQRKLISITLVTLQVACMVVLFITGRLVCDKVVLLTIQFVGVALLVWTWFNLVPGKFHIMPDTIKYAKLVTTGPFRLIRHPMYASLLIYLLPLVINYFSYLRLAVLLVFSVNMIIKLLYEEKLLKLRFPEYGSYMKRSYRLVPFIF